MKIPTALVALCLASTGVLLLAESAQASPSLPCLIGHSYYSGCLVCEPPAGSDYCACAPECEPMSDQPVVGLPQDAPVVTLTVAAPLAPAVLP